MFGYPVLTTVQPIVGVDMHMSIPPPPPVGPVMVPHPVVWGTGLSQKIGWTGNSKASSPESGCTRPVAVGFGYACGQQHDAGPHLGHLWPNVFYPLISYGASSKSHFGSSTVRIAVAPDKGGSEAMAVNVYGICNLNLHCHDFPFPPFPSGLSFTIHYSVTAGFSFGDLLWGWLSMCVDMALGWLMAAACEWLSKVMAPAFAKLLGRSAQSMMRAAQSDIFENGVRFASDLMNDGAGFFASNGRLFVDSWRFMASAARNAWENEPGEVLAEVINTFVTDPLLSSWFYE
jgi:hypothetical protein